MSNPPPANCWSASHTLGGGGVDEKKMRGDTENAIICGNLREKAARINIQSRGKKCGQVGTELEGKRGNAAKGDYAEMCGKMRRGDAGANVLGAQGGGSYSGAMTIWVYWNTRFLKSNRPIVRGVG